MKNLISLFNLSNLKCLTTLLAYVPIFLFSHRAMYQLNFTITPGKISSPAATIMVIIDHWFKVMIGQEPWLNLNFFFPIQETLGYSDTFFLYGMIYSGLRIFGLDMFSAFQLIFFLSGMIGFTSATYLFHRCSRVPFLWSLAAAATCTFPNGLFAAIGFTQLQLIHFFPLVCIFAIKLREASRSLAWSRWMFASGLGALFAALFYTCFGISWFIGFYGILFCLFYATLVFLAQGIQKYKMQLGLMLMPLALCLLVFSVLMIPFLRTYIPVLNSFGEFGKAQIRLTLPHLHDLLNVGWHNYWWTDVYKAFFPRALDVPLGYELVFGFTPIVMVLFILGFLYGILKLSRRQFDFELILLIALALAVFANWMVMTREWGGWFKFVIYLPGAKAIRAVFRSNLILLFPAVWVAAIACKKIFADISLHRLKLPVYLTFLFLLFLCYVEQTNLNYHGISIAEQRQLLEDLRTKLPKNCKAFVMTNVLVENSSKHQRQAQILSAGLGIPTINGYSSHFPKGMPPTVVGTDEYVQMISNWLEVHKLGDQACVLRLEERRFTNTNELTN